MNGQLRVLVVDDERLARKKVIRLLRRRCPEAQVFEAGDGIEALDLLERELPQLVFLDIEMPGLSGMELLMQLDSFGRSFALVVQTAFDQYAVQAFDENACDYLLKPFDEERFDQAFDKALLGLSQNVEKGVGGLEVLGRLATRLRSDQRWLRHVSANHRGVGYQIPVGEVQCFRSSDHYTSIFRGKEEFLSKMPLDRLECLLDPYLFQRIHRNALVNRDFVRTLEGQVVTLQSGLEIEVSRRRKAEFVKWLRDLV